MERLKFLSEVSLVLIPMFLANAITFPIVIQIKDYSSILFFILVTVINFGGVAAGVFLVETVKQKRHIRLYKKIFWHSVELTDTGPVNLMAAEDWVITNTRGKWSRDYKTFQFSKEEDATHFKLTCF